MIAFKEKTLIDRGWSGDKKYRAVTEAGETYLYRVSAPETFQAKKTEFEMTKRLLPLDLPMCRPVEFGENEEGVYSVQTWIDGEDLEEVISRYTGGQQYAFGLDAGKIIKKIHSIPAPEGQLEWNERFTRKMNYKIQKYTECPIKIDGGECFINYINENRHLLAGRPQTFQHGDYHTGNMMIGKDGRLYVIDFNRFDFGDPWEEFNRIVWCAQASPLFATGMLDGYFDGLVPEAFFRLLALYISSNTLSSVYWAIPFGEKEINVMLNQAQDVLTWYDRMQNPVPTWYKRP